MDNSQNKTPRTESWRKKRVATPSKPPVVIPIIVVPIDVHIALVIPPVEGDEMYRRSSISPPPDYSRS